MGQQVHHAQWSMGSSPTAPEDGCGRWKGMHSGGASSLTFGVDGEWLQSSSRYGSSSCGASSLLFLSDQSDKVRAWAWRQWEKGVRVASKVRFKRVLVRRVHKEGVGGIQSCMQSRIHRFPNWINISVLLGLILQFDSFFKPEANRWAVRCIVQHMEQAARGQGAAKGRHGTTVSMGRRKNRGGARAKVGFGPSGWWEKEIGFPIFGFNLKWILFKFKQFLNGFEN
jgi:hypothetical protein